MKNIRHIIGATVLSLLLAVMPADASANRNSSETGTRQTPATRERTPTPESSSVMAGEWELEGSSMFDTMFVYIDPDPRGVAEEFIDEFEPLDFAVETGFQYIGESRMAPDGCRLFSYSGPMGIPMFIALCSGNDHILIAGGTDKDVLDKTMEDFADGKRFRIPRGYTRS